jgi:hypothetical protein
VFINEKSIIQVSIFYWGTVRTGSMKLYLSFVLLRKYFLQRMTNKYSSLIYYEFKNIITTLIKFEKFI